MTQWTIAFRQIARKPAFALAAVFLLAGGIAANTTVFSLVATVFLKPLPYPDADRLVYVFEANTSKKEGTSLVAPARLEDWNRLNRTFTAVAGYYSDSKTDRTGSLPERLRAFSVSPRYFAVYRAAPVLGRTFNAAEETYGGPKAVVLSYELWTRRFGRAASAIGSRLRLGNDAYTVIGVMPSTFVSPTVDVWLAAPLVPALAQARDARFYTGIGRLKPGVSPAQAQADLLRVQGQLGQEFPRTDRGWSAIVSDMKESIIGDHGRFLWVALAAVGVLLLLACINLAALMLGHIHQRRHELSVRASLGATRRQLVGMVLREAALLVAAGTALGIGLSSWTVAAAGALLRTLPRVSELQLDWRSLVFTALLGALTLFLVGLLPAWQATRFEFTAGLSQGGRTETGNRHTAQQWLLLGQFAMTVVLLVSAGLLLESYRRLTKLDPGFQASHVLTFHLGAEWSEDRTAIGKLQQELITTLQDTPGVLAAGMTNFLPTDEATLRYQYRVDGLSSPNTDNTFTAGSRTVSGGYLTALQVGTVAGTNCPVIPADMSQPPKALVNRSFADHFSEGQNLSGRNLHILGAGLNAAFEITGVVADAREDSLRTPAVPYVYTCSVAGGWPDPEYVVRTQGDPQAFTSTLRQIVHRLAPDRALFGVQTMQAHLDTALEQPRLTAQVIAGFALAAVLLAACGLYSVCTLLVATRTREIGTRMALGARPTQVVKALLSRATKVLAVGMLLGVALAILAGTLMRSLLFGVAAFDPPTLAGVCALLFIVCLLAMVFPALRAVSIDPVQAIREQ